MTVLQKIIQETYQMRNPYSVEGFRRILETYIKEEQQQTIDAYIAGGQHEYGRNAYTKNPHPDLETYIQSLNQ